jgi:uncharacterized membrane protein
MSKHHTVVISAVSGLMALGLATAAPEGTAADHEKDMEKCYGIAEAGKNDCQTAYSSCAGTSKTDGDPSAWILLPQGTCEKIVGGSLEPGKSTG